MGEDPPGRRAKQVIVIRRDLKMRRGKEIAQGAHASMMWLTKRFEDWVAFSAITSAQRTSGARATFTDAEREWVADNFRKVTCQVPDEDALLDVVAQACRLEVMAYLVRDSGLTEFGGVETATAAAIGPAWEDDVDKVTGALSLY